MPDAVQGASLRTPLTQQDSRLVSQVEGEMDDLHHRIHFLFRRIFLKSRWDSIFEHLPVENGTGSLYG